MHILIVFLFRMAFAISYLPYLRRLYHPVSCEHISSEILAKYQGSAVDAAIATIICTGVINFYGSGIGGGHFAMIYDT